CPFPAAEAYEGFPQHENGIGIARSFEAALLGDRAAARGVRPGFFAWVDGAPAAGYRAPRETAAGGGLHGEGDGLGRVSCPGDGRSSPEPAVAIVTGEYGAAVIEPLLCRLGWPDVRVIAVHNRYLGANIRVA